MGFFGGLIFGPGIFLGFVGSLRDFFCFDFCPHSIIPVCGNLEYHPPPPPPPPPRRGIVRKGLSVLATVVTKRFILVNLQS